MSETVRIAALGHAGDGIAETEDGRVFVPFTLPGETVVIERSGNRGRLVDIEQASPLRVPPVCRHFGTCGGCALQHMERDAYLAWKREVVAKSFALAGIAAEVEPIVPIAAGTRRRAVFSAVKTARGVMLGFQRRGSNEIIAIEECPVLVPAIVSRLAILREIAAARSETAAGGTDRRRRRRQRPRHRRHRRRPARRSRAWRRLAALPVTPASPV